MAKSLPNPNGCCCKKDGLSAVIKTNDVTTNPTKSRLSSTLLSLAYWTLLVVFSMQLVSIVQTASLLAKLTMCDTLFLVITGFPHCRGIHNFVMKRMSTSSKIVSADRLQPFLVVCACVVFEALMFVNFTHSLEDIFCAEVAHTHLSSTFLLTVLLSTLAKAMFLIILQLSHRAAHTIAPMSLAKTAMLHLVAPTLATVMLYAHEYYNLGIERVDAYITLVFSVILSIIVIPTFMGHLKYLLLQLPEGISVENLTTKIEEQIPNVKCLHFHAFECKSNEFEAILHIALLEKSAEVAIVEDAEKEENDSSESELMESDTVQELMDNRMNEVIQTANRILKKAGAKRITIQPYASDSAMIEKCALQWNRNCITKECSEQKSCCAIDS